MTSLARFIAIVWILALAYKGLDLLGSWIFGASLDSGRLDSALVVPEATDAHCSELIAGVDATKLDAAAGARTRRSAFELGASLGGETAVRNAERVAESELPHLRAPSQRARLAGELGVPVPELPETGEMAKILSELSFHLAGDPQCVAALLAETYSSEHASLYRFGAVIAQAALFRELGMAPAATFAEIRHYGATAGVPEALWESFVRAVDPRDKATAGEEARQALARLEAWIEKER